MLFYLFKSYPMKLARLGSAVIVNNLELDFPGTVPDVKAMSSTLDTIGFEVKSHNGLNAQVTFPTIFLGDFCTHRTNSEEKFIKTAVLTRTNPRQ